MAFGGTTQRWADLDVRAVTFHRLVGVEEQVLGTRFGPHSLSETLRPLDALQSTAGAEMDDVRDAARRLTEQDCAVDRLLLGPWRHGGREMPWMDLALGDELVLEVVEDVAVLAVEHDDA